MKFIDKVLRFWRVHKAIAVIPKSPKNVFDIGCDDGYLLARIADDNIKLSGCDPRLSLSYYLQGGNIFKGSFPEVMDLEKNVEKFDVIFALAVFEHFSEENLEKAANKIEDMLSNDGVLIVTIPHQFVDKILYVLSKLSIIEGQALEEHHEFPPNLVVEILSTKLSLTKHMKFQFGLNNLYVFQKGHII